MTSEVLLEPHDGWWLAAAETEAKRLLAASSTLIAVHHIGSTSIAGIMAKPIIDLLGVTTDLSSFDRQKSVIQGLGYNWRGEYGMLGRRYCTLSDSAGRRLFHLHCYSDGDPAIRRHLGFRDHLRAFPAVATAYEQEKLRCAGLHRVDGGGYTECKSAWIRHVEQTALRKI
jgi:GrpB-like predicted nucleotidyltransferase (UPF0157 family)